jgi:hypothetical protein
MVVTPEGEEHLLCLVQEIQKILKGVNAELEWISGGSGGSFALRT